MRRAMGGPFANLTAILIAWLLRFLFPQGPFGRDLVDTFAVFNALIGTAALLPTPSFDGGTLLKWSVYKKTGSLEEATNAVRKAGLSIATLLAAGGIVGVLLGRWITGISLSATSLFVALDALRRE
jgi:Zn-dependent protease